VERHALEPPEGAHGTMDGRSVLDPIALDRDDILRLGSLVNGHHPADLREAGYGLAERSIQQRELVLPQGRGHRISMVRPADREFHPTLVIACGGYLHSGSLP